MKNDKWISSKETSPVNSDGDEYGYVLAWRLGRAMIIQYDEVIPENASHWMPLPKKPIKD